ncbi:hypothetical protein WMY93_016800 [Mugilogobius chulae]|uniref:Uncharacterized protein n=1 Tax=Mugilogobius chulae TaxID=88201 RepID=A0AAW0NMM0_9GOBI
MALCERADFVTRSTTGTVRTIVKREGFLITIGCPNTTQMHTDRRNNTSKATESTNFVKSDDKYNWYSEDYRQKRGFTPAPAPSTSASETIEDYKVRVKSWKRLQDLEKEKLQVLQEKEQELSNTVALFEESQIQKKAMEDKVEDLETLVVQIRAEETQRSTVCEQEMEALKEELRGQQQETTTMEKKAEDLETLVVHLRAEEVQRSTVFEQRMEALKEELRGQQQEATAM